MIRTHFIIKPRIQLKYLFFSVAIVALTALAVYYVFWSALVSSPGLENLSAGEWRALEMAYNTGFAWVVLILALAIGLESIFFFHRLIGPITVFEKVIKAISEGDLRVFPHYRRHDELKDIAGEIQTMVSRLRRVAKEEKKTAGEIGQLIDEGNFPKAKEKLASLAAWYKTEE